MNFKHLDHVIDYLNQIPRFRDGGPEEANFGLESVRRFCQQIGNPEDRLNIIHVAGTNGKGTTCRYLSSVYQTAGYRCGMFISPHLRDFRERFSINGEWIGEQALVTFFNRFYESIEQCGLSYFEICTVLAFWWFEQQQVDLAVLETGLGGRLDATNVVKSPMVSVITNISKDHQQLLGDTLEAISREKAGIIKKGRPVVIGNVKQRARTVIWEEARRLSAPLHEIEALNPRYHNHRFWIDCPQTEKFYSGYRAPVNAYNIAVVWRVTSLLNDEFPCNLSDVKQGIERTADLYSHTGTFERLHSDYHWYFDGAHNPEALQSLCNALDEIRPLDEWIVVFSLMRDKITPEVLNAFSDFKKKYYYSLEIKRAAPFDEVDKQLRGLLPFPTDQETPGSFLINRFESEFVIFTGSLYFYDHVRNWINAVSSE